MLLISIDGACRRNGKPDCVTASGVYIQKYDKDELISSYPITDFEINSTNQRGELRALLAALVYLNAGDDDALIVTDSEYIFNTMTKNWYTSWINSNWKTSTGSPVKNADLWESIVKIYNSCVDKCINAQFYHIKGHCIPFGSVTAERLLTQDDNGAALMKEVSSKYDAVCSTSKKANLENANKLSVKNNGFELSPDILKRFVVANVMADLIATRCVEKVDAMVAGSN